MEPKKSKAVEKVKRVPPMAWGPHNPPPLSPGRPPKQDDEAMLVAEKAGNGGIPERLAALRVAVKYVSRQKAPKNSMVRFYWELRNRNPREFASNWERLEKEFEGGSGGGGGTGAGSGKASVGDVVEATETDEELREAIVELLRKYGEKP